MKRAGAVLVALLVLASAANAQSLMQRVNQAPDGAVHLSFAARPGVCGDGHNISTSRYDDEWESGCTAGPVRVSLTVRSHRIVRIRSYVGGRWRSPAGTVTDLGLVSAPVAADYLLDLAVRLDSI